MEQAFPLPVESEDHDKLDDYLELLAVISQDFATSLDVEATVHKALHHIMAYLDAEAASVFLLENDDTEIVCRVCVGPVDITGIRLPAGKGIVGQSIDEGECLIVREAYKDPRFASMVDEQSGFKTRSILCAPMSVKDRRLGAMELINKRSGDGLFDETDRRMLQALASSAALALINAQMTKLMVDQERTRRELELAAEMQRSLLPARRPSPFPVSGINLPARTVSGDFFDYFTLWDGRICFNLGDVSGKGINAALLMAKTSSLYRCLGKSILEPGKLLGLINREVCETTTRGMFVTMVGGIYDPRTGIVRMANAGHEPPLFRTREGDWRSLPGEAPPLGISPDLFPNARFPEIELKLDDGSLYIFTDGVTEGHVEGSDALGVDGFKTFVENLQSLTPNDRLDRIAQNFEVTEGELHDDLTILLLERHDEALA